MHLRGLEGVKFLVRGVRVRLEPDIIKVRSERSNTDFDLDTSNKLNLALKTGYERIRDDYHLVVCWAFVSCTIVEVVIVINWFLLIAIDKQL